MKFGPVTKLDKRNKKMSKKIHDDAMSETSDVIDIFPIYGQFGAIRKPIPAVKLIFLLILAFYLTKTESRTKKSSTQLSHYCFEWRYYFGQKRIFFCKIKRALELKGIFSETKHVCTYVPNFKFLA